MKKSNYFFVLLLSALILTLWNSCKDNDLNNITNPEFKANLEKENVMLKGYITKEQMLDTFIVVESKDPPDKALDCKTMIIEGWEILKFEPKSGKNVGIWPVWNPWYIDPTYLAELHQKYGFSYMLHWGAPLYFDQAKLNGFPENKIMCLIDEYYWLDVINNYGANVLGYYLDEPVLNGISMSVFSTISNYIATNTNSKFITGDYKPDIPLDSYVLLADEVYTTAYSNWYKSIFGYWFEGSNDQRPLWTLMKNRYGNKNNSNWINSYKDLGEFSDLCGKAVNLGLNTIWLYQDDDKNSSLFSQKQHLMQFCNSAWYNGFLRRFSQYTTYYYRCLDADCATCESEEGNWVLYKTIKGDIREDFPAN